MSKFYEDEGWEVVVVAPREGDGKPVLEHYAVACKNQVLARKKIEPFRGAGAKVAGVIPADSRGHQELQPSAWPMD